MTNITQKMLNEQLAELLEQIAKETGEKIQHAYDLAKKRIVELEARVAEVEERGLEYVGTFQRAQSYRRGSVCTHDGSMWCAIKDTQPDDAPGSSSRWQLCVKAPTQRSPTNHSGRHP